MCNFAVSDLWIETQTQKSKQKKKREVSTPDRRRKPVTVSGKFLVTNERSSIEYVYLL
jgi:hypothetical protein